MVKQAIVKRKESLKDKLDSIDNILMEQTYKGFYESRLRIELGMWEKGLAIEVSEYRGVNYELCPTYHQLGEKTDRSDKSLKKWHELYLKYPDKKEYLPIAEDKARTWTDKIFARRALPSYDDYELPEGKYNIIYADPPWEYGDKLVEGYGAAEHHYKSLSCEEISFYEDENKKKIQDIFADKAVLFLWVTSPILDECWPVISAWGFEYKTSFVWDKIKHNYGHYNSVRHEFLLICTRGSFLPQNNKLYDSVQSIERTSKHSEKPEEFRKIIESMYPEGKRIELFARKKTQGWDVYGDEC